MWAAIIAAVGVIVAAIVQGSQNKDLAQYQNQQNKKLLEDQLEYDTPKAQMERFQEAGLNPSLIYGSGSGISGNQGSPLQFPDIKPADYQGAGASAGQAGIAVLEAKLLQSQRQNLDSKTIESQARSGLIQVQQDIAAANPLLNKAVYNSMIESWISSAQIKAAEAGLATQKHDFMKSQTVDPTKSSSKGLDAYVELSSNGWQKMEAELRNIQQRYKLGEADQKLKASVLESKEFQNDILEIQSRFMREGDITPQHMVTFMQLLLMRLAR